MEEKNTRKIKFMDNYFAKNTRKNTRKIKFMDNYLAKNTRKNKIYG
jgi:hypothetical protein